MRGKYVGPRATIGHVFVEYSRCTRWYTALKLREQRYKTVTSHVMTEGLGSPFDSDEHQPCTKQNEL